MNARIAKLEALLGRIQKRSTEPRPASAVVRAAPAAAVAPAETATPAAPATRPFGSAPSALPLAAPETATAPVSAAPAPAPSQTSLPAPELELDEPGESVPPPAGESNRDSLLPDSLDDLGEVVIDEGPASGSAMTEPVPLSEPAPSAEEATLLGVRTGPTPEQVGATVSLDEGPDDKLELDEPMLEPVGPSSHPGARLEAELPVSIQNVKSAQSTMEDLQRLRLGESTPVEARVSARPIASTNVVDFVNASKSFTPKTFLELLDASLELK